MDPTILFVANAGAEVGGGHVMRSLTLARALAGRGAKPVFLASPAVAGVLDAFGPEVAREPATALDPAALADAATGVSFDAVVFDHYGLARAEHEAMARGRPALVVDDLADRPLGADIVLDPGPGRTDADYALFAPNAELLLGPLFAPVRPEFASLRTQALARRGGPPARALISLGLTDVGGITARVVEHLRRRDGQLALDVVLGSGAPSLPGLTRIASRDPRLNLHVDTQEMAELTARADIAVGAAGSTTWERCVLGLPSILLIVADNQRTISQAMTARNAALVVDLEKPGFEDALERALVRLLADSRLRAAFSAASAELCDGLGADRVAEAFLALMASR